MHSRHCGQTVLGVYLKRTCSRVTSAPSALGVLNDYALYKSTHSLTLTHSASVFVANASDTNAIGNESVPMQLTQYWFPGLAIFNAKIWIYIFK